MSSPTTWAQPRDVRDRWLGTDQLPADEVIQAWLGDAETIIFTEFPALEAKLTDDPDGAWAKRVVFVEVQLATQALRNPDGVRQRSQTAGPLTDAVTYGSETIQASMALTPAHRALLSGSSGRHVGIDMTATPAAPTTPLDGAWINGPNGYEPGATP